MQLGDLVLLKSFTRDLRLMNQNLSGGIAVLIYQYNDSDNWDMLITPHPIYGGKPQIVESVNSCDILEVLSESRRSCQGGDGVSLQFGAGSQGSSRTRARSRGARRNSRARITSSRHV